MIELQEFISRMEILHDQFITESLQTNPNTSDCHLANVILDELGNRSRKHLEQIGSLISQLVHLNLLQSNTCFVEMGAGRGQLSHELYACLKDNLTIDFVLIERDHPTISVRCISSFGTFRSIISTISIGYS